MTEFYYIVHSQSTDNVGTINAETEESALAKLNGIYCPEVKGQPHENVSVEMVNADQYEVDKKRIIQERREEAEA